MATFTDEQKRAAFKRSYRGTKGRRRKREVAGPYRDQSSVPSIRAGATPREHRKVTVTLPDPFSGSNLEALDFQPDPGFLYAQWKARQGADNPDLGGVLDTVSSIYDRLSRDNPGADVARSIVGDELSNLYEASKESIENELKGTASLKRPSAKQLQALGTLTAAAPVGDPAAIAAFLRRPGAAEALGGRAAEAATKAAQRAAPKASQTVADIIGRLPAGVRTAAKAGAKGASWPLRHPVQAPFAFATPQAITSGDPRGALTAALEGKGLYGKLAGSVGGLPGEAVSLPAAIVPSVFLTGKAGVEAAGGHPESAERLWQEWKDTGLLPALASGDLGEAAHRFGEHPLYSGLEASGALNALGRGIGAGLRAVPGKDWAGLEREPLVLSGTKGQIKVDREYSRDAIRQFLQRQRDKRLGNEIGPKDRRLPGRDASHYEKQAANRFAADRQTERGLHSRELLDELAKIAPKKWLGGRVLDRKSADAIPLAVERITQDPSTFYQDLSTYKKLIDFAAEHGHHDGRPLNKAELKRNRENAKFIEDAMKGGNPEKIVAAADKFIELQKPILQEMVDLGLITQERADFASAIPWARVHMGADWGRPNHVDQQIAEIKDRLSRAKEDGLSSADRAALARQIKELAKTETTIDAAGNEIPFEEIASTMRRHGVEPPGFLSHRAPTAGDFYRPPFGGASLDKGSRSGASVLAGTQQGGIEGLVRQLRRSQGLVDRARHWNEAITEFGLNIPGVKTWADAKKVMEDPAAYGIPEGQELMAVPRHPFNATKDEIEGALGHQDPVAVDEQAGAHINSQIDLLNHDVMPDDTPIAFFPKKVADELRADSTPSEPWLKALQGATNLFKRTVLPFSVSFYIGNVFDNYMRTLMQGGFLPHNIYAGVKAANALSPERREQLLSGALYSSTDRLAPRRSVENVVTGGDALSRGLRQAAEWSHEHGYKQAAVKFVPKNVARLSKFLLATNRLLSERLPEYGLLGKAVLKDLRKTQGSWTRALKLSEQALNEWAKGLDRPETRIKLQRELETTLGNYSQMSPQARKVLSNTVPFWTWMRAAYKYVYLTMPAHRSVQTGLLVATAAATQVEREQLGLEKGADGQLESWQLGGIPVGKGQVIPMAGYNSFGYAADPLEAISKAGFAQIQNALSAAGGVDWRGEPIPEGDRLAAAALALGGGFLPGFNQLFRTDQGSVEFAPHATLPRPYDARKAEDRILVPAGGGSSSSSSGTDWGAVFGGGGASSGTDWGKVFGGG